jgi:hypothetical protein
MVVSVSLANSTTEAITYIPGMAVKLFVPYAYGMFQANNLTGTILGIVNNGSTADMTLNINSSRFDTFVVPADGFFITPASISPAGSRNLQYDNTNINFVPFKSLNNRGN